MLVWIATATILMVGHPPAYAVDRPIFVREEMCQDYAMEQVDLWKSLFNEYEINNMRVIYSCVPVKDNMVL